MVKNPLQNEARYWTGSFGAALVGIPQAQLAWTRDFSAIYRSPASKLTWFDPKRDLPEQETSDYRSASDLERLKSLRHPDHDTEHWP
jgi:hypothetical protein